MTTALDRAKADVASSVRETEGHNRSPIIDAFNRAVGIPLGSPYCASAVSACFRPFERPRMDKFPYSGSSQAIRRAFESRGRLTRDPDRILGWRGALFGWTNGDGIHGHIGFVGGRLTDLAGFVVGIRTFEYNTGLTGGRDGEGAFTLIRRLDKDGLWRVEDAARNLNGVGRRLWFLDTSDIPGGAWWI